MNQEISLIVNAHSVNELKHCATCSAEKPVTAFHRHPAMPGGRAKHCKDCLNAKYRRWHAEGHVPKKRSKPSPLKGIPRGTLAERFWPKVDKRGPDECWNWTGALKPDGYGLTWHDNRNIRVHRAAWILAGRELPASPLVLDHLCHNRSCVNVAHLRVATPRQNSVENSDGPFARNAKKRQCINGHDLMSPGNAALLAMKGPKGTPMVGRYCLACWPSYWNNPDRIFITA